MLRRPNSRIFVSLLLVLLYATACRAEKRALLIGINDYSPPDNTASPVAGPTHASDSRFAQGGHWPSLRGPSEDVAAMHVLLRESYGFTDADITVLDEKDATHDGILAAIDKLVADTKPGDLVVFYYSGHGSRRLDTLSSKNHLDETIVPIDAWKGAKDVRDKEMALRFNQIVYDKHAHLTAIYDSCNSGTMARGVTSSVQRALAYDDRDVAEDKKKDAAIVTEADLTRKPQDGDAIILSAAASNEFAQEATYPDDGKVHGAFTRALIMVLKSRAQTLSADDVVAEVTSILHADSTVPSQQPSVEGRLKQSLFGDPVPPHPLHVRATFVSDATPVTVKLDMGSAGGFGVGTQFTSIDAGEKTVVEIKSLDKPLVSTAEVVKGPASVKPGATFELTKMMYPQSARLVIYAAKAGAGPTAAAAAKAKALFPNVKWVDDPATAPVDFLVVEEDKGWVAYSQTGAAMPAGPAVKGAGFLLMGPPASMVAQMQQNPPFQTQAFSFTHTLSEANYLLAARVATDGKPEYALLDPIVLTPHKADAWVKSPESDTDDADLNGGINPEIVCRNDVSLPVRTAWLHDKADGTGVSLALTRRVVRLGKLRVWMKSAALAPGLDAWPYRLTLTQPDSDTPLSDAPLHPGQKYDVRLEASADELAAHRPKPKYVYLFGFDCSANAVLLYPQANQNGDGKTPEQSVNGSYPASVTLFQLQQGITYPIGADTVFFMATEEKLTNPDLVTNDGVLERGTTRGSAGALNELISDLNDAGTRGPASTPTHWTVQQVVVPSRQ
jgi:hypothetical protein